MFDKYWEIRIGSHTGRYYKYRGIINRKNLLILIRKILDSIDSDSVFLRKGFYRRGWGVLFIRKHIGKKRIPYEIRFRYNRADREYELKRFDEKMQLWQKINGKYFCGICDRILSRKYIKSTEYGHGRLLAGVYCKRCWRDNYEGKDWFKSRR